VPSTTIVKEAKPTTRLNLTRGMNRESLLALTVGLGLIFAYGLVFYRTHFQGVNYPRNTLLFNPFDRFQDFFIEAGLGVSRNPYFVSNGYEATYFPLSYFLLYILGHISKNIKVCLVVFLSIFTLYFIWYGFRSFRRGNRNSVLSSLIKVFIICLGSYPFMCCLDRANLECLVFIFVSLFVWAYQERRLGVAAFLLAVVTSMKLFPGVFILLFLSDRKYRHALQAVAWTLAMTLMSLVFFQGGVAHNIFGVLRGQEIYRTNYLIDIHGLHFNSSFFGVVRLFILGAFASKGGWIPSDVFWRGVVTTYSLAAVLFLGAFSALIYLRKFKFWEKVCLITLVMLLVPPVSFNYRLIHLFTCLFVFLNDTDEKSGVFPYLVTFLFGLLLIPKDYEFLEFPRILGITNYSLLDIGYSVIANPALMILLGGLILWRHFHSRKMVY